MTLIRGPMEGLLDKRYTIVFRQEGKVAIWLLSIFVKCLFSTTMIARVRARAIYNNGRSFHSPYIPKSMTRRWDDYARKLLVDIWDERDRDFVHPRVEMEVWQPLSPRVEFRRQIDREIAQQSRHWRYAKCHPREQRTIKRQDVYFVVN